MYRILYVHHGGAVGGAPVSLLKLAQSLDKREFMPTVAFTSDGPVLDYAKVWGVEATVVPMKSAFLHCEHVPISLRMLSRFLVYLLPSIRAIRQFIRSVRPDLVHLNTSALLPAAIGARMEGIPIIWHVREVIPSTSIVGAWQARVIQRLAGMVIVTSRAVAEEFGQLRQNNIVLIPNAVDLQEFHLDLLAKRVSIRMELGIDIHAFTVGIIGSVQAVKGHFLLIEAAKLIAKSHPDIQFVVVAGGVGPDYAASWKGKLKRLMRMPFDNLERMQRMVSNYNLDRSFRFIGFRQDIPRVIAALDIVVFPSQASEGFGRPLIEAMAMKRPVVTTDIGPSREIIDDQAGLFVRVGDPCELSKAIVRLLSEPELCVRMGEAGRLRVENCYSLERHVGCIQQLYWSILGKPKFKEV